MITSISVWYLQSTTIPLAWFTANSSETITGGNWSQEKENNTFPMSSKFEAASQLKITLTIRNRWKWLHVSAVGNQQQNSLFVAGSVRDGNSYPAFITASICALVWVVRLWVNPTILDNELKCIIHETTIAALIPFLVTVHQFLLRKRDQVICDYLIDSLDGPNCWEGPATPCRIAPSVTSSKPSRCSFCLRWKLYSCWQFSSHRGHRYGGMLTMMTK
jgi:hypothetical protein